jgi:hypothetical protein
MRYKIVRFQKLMWRNMMRSTKNKKVSVLHYNIDVFSFTPSKILFISLQENLKEILTQIEI